jgi:hypothetical protein
MNTELMVDEEKEAEEERAAHTAFDAEQQHHRESATAEEESDDDDGIDWSGPGPEEKAMEQRALVVSFETLKKTEDDANEALRQRLLEDVVAHRALVAAQKWRREGGNDEAGSSTAPRGDK